MKRIILLILPIVLVLAFVGCDKISDNITVEEPNNSNADNVQISYSFRATVLKTMQSSILVQPSEDSNENKSSDKISVSTKDLSIGFDIVEGDEIVVYYDGLIAESYPAQIYTTYKIEKYVPEIIMKSTNISNAGLTFKFEVIDKDISKITTGSYYIVERTNNNKHMSIPFVEMEGDLAWTSEAYIIEDGSSFDVNWKWLYGELSAGNYRIGKQISFVDEDNNFINSMIYAEFEIK